MDDCEAQTWPERLRDELIPYIAFYAIALLWLLTASAIGAWDTFPTFFFLGAVALAGLPVTAMVSLMLVWRMFMIGIDSGRVLGMVTSVGAAMVLLIATAGAVPPVMAIGRLIGEAQKFLLHAG